MSQHIYPNPALFKNASSQTLQASAGMLTVKTHLSPIRKRQNKYGLFEKVTMRKEFDF